MNEQVLFYYNNRAKENDEVYLSPKEKDDLLKAEEILVKKRLSSC